MVTWVKQDKQCDEVGLSKQKLGQDVNKPNTLV